MGENLIKTFVTGVERLPSVVKASLSQTRVDFLIAGAQKCGTSALFEYLRTHPELVFPPQRKELHFFDNEDIFKLDILKYSFYHSFFPTHDTSCVCGESTPEYMYWDTAPRRIWDYNPKMKLIMILRSPIDRAYSHWNMMHARGLEHVSFWEAITTESDRCRSELPYQHRFFSYLSRGLYTEQIRRVWHYFPPEQTLILKNKDLRYAPKETLLKVTNFLGVQPFQEFEAKKIKKKQKTTKMSQKERDYLIQYFEHDIRALERLLSWDCSEWLI